MTKIKWTIMTFAVLFSIGAAFATRTRPLTQLYYWTGGGYAQAGTLGLTYVCSTPSTAVCTYTFSNGVYTPCTTDASYTPIEVAPAKPKPETNLVIQKGK